MPPWLEALIRLAQEQAAQRLGLGREMVPIPNAPPAPAYRTPFLGGRLGGYRPGAGVVALAPEADQYAAAHEAGHLRVPTNWQLLRSIPPAALNQAVQQYGEVLDVQHPRFLEEILAQLYAQGYRPGPGGLYRPTPINP